MFRADLAYAGANCTSNDKDFGDYTEGFAALNDPVDQGVKLSGCLVNGFDIEHPLGDPQEEHMRVALAYRESGSCPPVAVAARAPGEVDDAEMYEGLLIDGQDFPGLILTPVRH